MSSSESCHFQKCCFCIPLETGCFIIGYLNLVGSLIATILSVIGISALVAISNDESKNIPAESRSALLAVGIVVLIILAVNLAFSVVLLIGLHQNKPGHLKAYLIFVAVFLSLSIILLIVSISTTGNWGQAGGRFIQLFFSAYFMLVIKSHYTNMKESNKQIA